MIPEGPSVPSPLLQLHVPCFAIIIFVQLLPWRQFIIFTIMVLESEYMASPPAPMFPRGLDLGVVHPPLGKLFSIDKLRVSILSSAVGCLEV